MSRDDENGDPARAASPGRAAMPGADRLPMLNLAAFVAQAGFAVLGAILLVNGLMDGRDTRALVGAVLITGTLVGMRR